MIEKGISLKTDVNFLHINIGERLFYLLKARRNNPEGQGFWSIRLIGVYCLLENTKVIEVHMELQSNKFSNKSLSILAWKLSIGSALSWELAKLLGSDHPYLAPLSVILTIQSTVDKTVSLSIKRLIGTIIGILVTVLIARHVTISSWSLGLLILLGCYISIYLKLDKKILHQVSLTILFVFVFEQKSKQYATDRLRDTLIGILIAGIIQLLLLRLTSRKS